MTIVLGLVLVRVRTESGRLRTPVRSGALQLWRPRRLPARGLFESEAAERRQISGRGQVWTDYLWSATRRVVSIGAASCRGERKDQARIAAAVKIPPTIPRSGMGAKNAAMESHVHEARPQSVATSRSFPMRTSWRKVLVAALGR